MKKSSFADLSLLLVAFVWGTTFVIVQNAVAVLEPFTFNGIRFFTAAVFLFVWMLVFYKRQLKQVNWLVISSGLIMGVFLFSGYAFQTFGLLYTTSSKAGFITGLSVVLVPLLAFLILKQKPKPHAIAGIAIATAGLYFLTMKGTIAVNYGDMLVLFCAISFGLHIVFTGKYASRFPALALTLIQISTVAGLNLAAAFVFEDWQSAFRVEVIGHPAVWTALLITSLLATTLAYLAQTKFQQYTSPTHVALIFAMEPVFAALTAIMWADERLGPKALIGCLFIFLGMILAELPEKAIPKLRRGESFEK